jgi:ribosomal protein S18 acetylase RimI-like enzyme
VLLDGIEVARVELDHDFRGSKHVGAPRLGSGTLEIQFIEVAVSHRRRGVGAVVVRSLVAAHADRRFLALSEEADEFWASLGWDRYDYWDGPHQYRPLFVQP